MKAAYSGQTIAVWVLALAMCAAQEKLVNEGGEVYVLNEARLAVVLPAAHSLSHCCFCPQPDNLDFQPKPIDYLANERTYLAWTRNALTM